MEIEKLLEIAVSKNASDLHLIVGIPPTLRIEGVLYAIGDVPTLTPESAKTLVYAILTPEQKEIFSVNRELDFSFEFGEDYRFRVNAYHQKGSPAAALRLIPIKIRSIDELNLPKICHRFTELHQGFVLVTGPTGHGKTTTLAAIVDEINRNRSAHIVTIEDPIEYVHKHRKSIISQREVHGDTHSWEVSLRSVLREDPDVVLIGEMRDYETIASALTIAETGHLVFATLHTNSAAQTVDRIVDVFPEHQQAQVKMQLSFTIEAVFSQRLLPALEGGRLPAAEVMVATTAVKATIREGKTHLIDNIIQTSGEVGMMTLESNLAQMVKAGKVSLDAAKAYALRPDELERQVRGRK